MIPCISQDILTHAMLIPVYYYNYIGNPKEQVCIGPSAQAWHSQFGTADIPTKVWNENEFNEETQENGKFVTIMKPAKDPLKIESMDFSGVLLSCVQALQAQNVALEKRILVLEKLLNV